MTFLRPQHLLWRGLHLSVRYASQLWCRAWSYTWRPSIRSAVLQTSLFTSSIFSSIPSGPQAQRRSSLARSWRWYPCFQSTLFLALRTGSPSLLPPSQLRPRRAQTHRCCTLPSHTLSQASCLPQPQQRKVPCCRCCASCSRLSPLSQVKAPPRSSAASGLS